MNTTHTIDATNRTIGRIASEAATLLMGKNTAVFVRNKAPKVKVTVANASKAKIAPKKLEQKIYTRHTLYPGGLRTETLAEAIEKKGYAEPIRRAVYGMLPGNKLRNSMMKNLIITE